MPRRRAKQAQWVREPGGSRRGELVTKRKALQRVVWSRWLQPEAPQADMPARELPQYRRLLVAILNSAGDGVLGLDRQGHTVFMNPAARRMLGYTSAQIIGKILHPMIHHTHRDGSPYPQEQCPNLRSLHGGTVERVSDDVFWRRDGSSFPVEYTSAPIRHRGTIVGIVVTFRDISEHVEAERLRDAQVELLQETSRVKDQFLAMLSHELRTPLNAVMGYANLLEDELATGTVEACRGYLHQLLAAAGTLEILFDHLLEMSRIQGRKLILAPRPVSLQELVAPAVASLADRAELKHQVIQVAVPCELLPVMVDDERIAEVIECLLDNAIKFSPEGGRIVLTARQEGDHARFEVTDHGPGIPLEEQDQLFRPFVQLDMSNTRHAGGMGLGLALSKALVEAHGGQIGVTSTPGSGATFYFTVPTYKAAGSHPGCS